LLQQLKRDSSFVEVEIAEHTLDIPQDFLPYANQLDALFTTALRKAVAEAREQAAAENVEEAVQAFVTHYTEQNAEMQRLRECRNAEMFETLRACALAKDAQILECKNVMAELSEQCRVLRSEMSVIKLKAKGKR
jgi:hypothetical protein